MNAELESARGAIRDISGAIAPASRAQALGAERRLAASRADASPLLERLAVWLAAARHAPRPRVARKRILVACADHGAGDPGVDFGGDWPTAAQLVALTSGEAALAKTARQVGAELALVDAGVFGGASEDPRGVVDLRLGAGTADIRAGPAMPEESAALAITSGIALSYSLAEEGLDVAALGALGLGSEISSTAVIAALTRTDPRSMGGSDAAEAEAALAASAWDAGEPLSVLSALGGYEIGVLAGAILGAASIDIPIVLDDHATAAAALLARALAPNARDYVLAAHGGSIPAHRAALAALDIEIEPLLSLGVSRGEGTGGALVLPALDTAAALLAPAEPGR